jgi:hypothetical protein
MKRAYEAGATLPRARLDLADLLPCIVGTPSDRRPLPENDCKQLVRRAMRANAVEGFSCLLAVKVQDRNYEVRDAPWLAEDAMALIRAAFANDGAECALSLLACLEERRRSRQELAKAELTKYKVQTEEAIRSGSPRPPSPVTHDAVVNEALQEIIQAAGAKNSYPINPSRMQLFCGSAPKAAGLVTLVREALAQPEPANRVAHALLLQTHRLCKTPPDDEDAPNAGLDAELCGCAIDGLSWPVVAADMPQAHAARGLATGRAIGGWDLSEGAEPTPVQWLNQVDDQRPPRILYLRRCVDVDVRPDVLGKHARACKPVSTDIVKDETTLDQCCHSAHSFQGSKPPHWVECNWACINEGTCSAYCSRRGMQLGKCHRFQVFKHKGKGWCLRTLTFIQKGEFIMEYVAERVTPKRGTERAGFDPNIEVYIMEVQGCPLFQLDAYYVRNVAAYAAFTCKEEWANMERQVQRSAL